MIDVWKEVMNLKKMDTRSRGIANNLTNDEIETVLATVDFFGGSINQVHLDLKICRYRVFDFLAMAIGGRLEQLPTKVLVYSFLKVKGDIDLWIDDLRSTDYDLDLSYQEITLPDTN